MIRYEMRPLRTWTDPVTPERQTGAIFRAGWDATIRLLSHEAEELGASYVVVQVDVTEGEIRRDGMLYARAKIGFPGVVVSFESRHGPLRYATDAFEEWKANVRAVALALQALRAVDRYGVTKRGEQYQGWKALPAGGNGSSGFASADEAIRWMGIAARDLGYDPTTKLPRDLYRMLARKLHPDMPDGSREAWDQLDQARQLLDLAGVAS